MNPSAPGSVQLSLHLLALLYKSFFLWQFHLRVGEVQPECNNISLAELQNDECKNISLEKWQTDQWVNLISTITSPSSTSFRQFFLNFLFSLQRPFPEMSDSEWEAPVWVTASSLVTVSLTSTRPEAPLVFFLNKWVVIYTHLFNYFQMQGKKCGAGSKWRWMSTKWIHRFLLFSFQLRWSRPKHQFIDSEASVKITMNIQSFGQGGQWGFLRIITAIVCGTLFWNTPTGTSNSSQLTNYRRLSFFGHPYKWIWKLEIQNRPECRQKRSYSGNIFWNGTNMPQNYSLNLHYLKKKTQYM